MVTATIDLISSQDKSLDAIERPSRMVRPKVKEVRITQPNRPRDYGECEMILIEKYGREKGQSYYEHIAVSGKSPNAIWTVCTGIVKEKIKMLQDLGLPQSSDMRDVHYFQLWQEWRAQNLHRTQD